MVKLGEWGYFQACGEDVSRWWHEDPGRFFRLGLRRVRWFWFGRHDWGESPLRQAVRLASTAVPGALAIIGALLLLCRQRHAWGLPTTAAVFPLVYYACLFMVRYRVPVEPVLLTLAAVTVVEGANAVRRGAASLRSRRGHATTSGPAP